MFYSKNTYTNTKKKKKETLKRSQAKLLVEKFCVWHPLRPPPLLAVDFAFAFCSALVQFV